MIVAGGTYREICEFPHDEVLFGSGLRAAAAVGEVSSETTPLHTYVADDAVAEARRKAGAYDFNIHRTESSETVTYHYIHNHSHPAKSSHSSNDRTLGRITGDAILRFGLVDGTAVVEGDRVVYDPQSDGGDRFLENGSSADTLALVLNREEALAFSEEDSISAALADLSSEENGPHVVVIKCGASGAVVRANGGTTEIPVYEPDTIWNIGSGDVFSAMFAVYWAELGLSAVEAAEEASLGTAYYCGTRQLPVPEYPRRVDGFDPTRHEPTIGEGGPTIYLAGPFFNPGEFWLMEQVEEMLSEEGADVIAPYFDIGRAEEYDDPTMVAEEDLEALEGADIVLALLDTWDPGTLFEVGYARDLGTPVVAYRTQPERSRMTMLEGTGCKLYSDLSTAVFKSIWAA